MWQLYTLWALYLVTMKIGIIGNLWVICSVIRNTRPQTYGLSRRPSDCLRSYIFVLALVDFFVVCSLAVRIVYIWDETLTFEFQIRRYLHRGFPAVTLLPFFLVLIPIFLTVKTIGVTPDRWDCRISDDSAWNRLTGLLVGACFILLLMLVSANYAEIVRHVHRNFSRRKARRRSVLNYFLESISCNGKNHRLPEPRYVREMTSSIIRVAVFHMVCWLPFCLVAMIPTETCSVVLISIRAISRINDKHYWVLWILILANWLTYLNSALNWIFYAVLNRDFRELIRSNTKRRKRSGMTYWNDVSSSNFTNKCSRQRLDRSSTIHVLAES